MGLVYTKQEEKMVVSLLRMLTAFLAICIITKVWTPLAIVRDARMMAEAVVRGDTASYVEMPGRGEGRTFSMSTSPGRARPTFPFRPEEPLRVPPPEIRERVWQMEMMRQMAGAQPIERFQENRYASRD